MNKQLSKETLEQLQKFNERYAAVEVAGVERIWNGELFQTFGDVEKKWENKYITITQGKKKKEVPIFSFWRKWPGRREYDKAVFFPGTVPDNYLNLWQGWAVTPNPNGDWSLFKTHIEQNICQENPEYIEWVYNWLAQLFQEPDKKMGTALVLRGKKGTGKTIFCDTIGKLVGIDKHYHKPSQSEHALGNFNALYEKALLVNLEESFWCHDKAGKSFLKDLITCEHMVYEEKGLPKWSGPNYTRVIINSNERFVVPADEDERRFMVLDVGKAWRKDRGKFGALVKQMKHGGYEGLLYFLLHYPLNSNIDLRNPPITKGLQQQQSLNEEPEITFFRDWLLDHADDLNPIWTKNLWKDYYDYCRANRIYPKKRQEFIAAIQEKGFEFKTAQRRCHGIRERVWFIVSRGDFITGEIDQEEWEQEQKEYDR